MSVHNMPQFQIILCWKSLVVHVSFFINLIPVTWIGMNSASYISSLVSFSTIVSLWFFHNDRAHVTHLFISIFVKFLLWRVGFFFDLRIHKRLTLLYNNLYSVPLCLLTRSSSLKHVRISTEETCKFPLKCSYILSIFFLSFLTWTKVECDIVELSIGVSYISLLHKGQELCPTSHLSIHCRWKMWWQGGKLRAISSSWKS